MSASLPGARAGRPLLPVLLWNNEEMAKSAINFSAEKMLVEKIHHRRPFSGGGGICPTA
jgi:hypothetical protein